MIKTPKHPNGFTLIEMTVATTMTAVLMLMLSSTWVMLNRPTSSLVAWGQLFQEMDIAVATMVRDLGGGLAGYRNSISTLPGTKREGVLLECKSASDLDGYHLQLCFDGANQDGVASWSTVDDILIDYYVDDATNTLVRRNVNTNEVFHVASNLSTSSNPDLICMKVINDPLNAANLRIQLTFQFPNYIPKDDTEPLTRTCILITKKKP